MSNLKNISLRIRIFLSMILLVLLASILILGVTVYQYDEQTKDYNIQRFERKESITKETIELELKNMFLSSNSIVSLVMDSFRSKRWML